MSELKRLRRGLSELRADLERYAKMPGLPAYADSLAKALLSKYAGLFPPLEEHGEKEA